AYRTKKLPGTRAQAIVEFAIVLPILLMLLVGILEVGRMIFIYAAVTNASREAARYASAVGLDVNPGDGVRYQKYNYCQGIRDIARRSALLMDLPDDKIIIKYDHGSPLTADDFDECPVGMLADTSIQVNDGTNVDRVVVKVTARYEPLVRLIPIPARDIESSSARTILGIYDLTTGQSSVSVPGVGGGGGGGGSGGGWGTPFSPTPPLTSTSEFTPTATFTPTNTATSAGPGTTPTPILSSTPSMTPTVTNTPTITLTPTMTYTPTMTFTPTATSTPVPGCDMVSAGEITYSGKTMIMTLTNPHETLLVASVRVRWNALTGSTNGKAVALNRISLGSTIWTGTDNSGDLTVTLPTDTTGVNVTIPGNNRTSSMIFTFDNPYKDLGPNVDIPSVGITLGTLGCETIIIQSP
ncbi:MAG TPA: TadE family protein, partial [Anaerolineales bacterium]|nr:TadE family protein [Anaerolineales bacterium]